MLPHAAHLPENSDMPTSVSPPTMLGRPASGTPIRSRLWNMWYVLPRENTVEK